MGAARASTAGHWGLAFNDLSEAQTACTIGRGMMGFAFFTTSLGTTFFLSLFLVSFMSHQMPFTHPVGVTLHNMFNTAATSLSTTWPWGQCKVRQPPLSLKSAKWMRQTLLLRYSETYTTTEPASLALSSTALISFLNGVCLTRCLSSLFLTFFFTPFFALSTTPIISSCGFLPSSSVLSRRGFSSPCWLSALPGLPSASSL